MILNNYLGGYDITKLDALTTKDVQDAATSALKSVPSYVVLGKTFGTPTFSGITNLMK
jgi:hypothetical protein